MIIAKFSEWPWASPSSSHPLTGIQVSQGRTLLMRSWMAVAKMQSASTMFHLLSLQEWVWRPAQYYFLSMSMKNPRVPAQTRILTMLKKRKSSSLNTMIISGMQCPIKKIANYSKLNEKVECVNWLSISSRIICWQWSSFGVCLMILLISMFSLSLFILGIFRFCASKLSKVAYSICFSFSENIMQLKFMQQYRTLQVLSLFLSVFLYIDLRFSTI